MATAIRTDTIDSSIQQGWFAKLRRNVKLSRRQWFWVIVIGIPLALSTYVGIRWHSISAMQEATDNRVQFFDGYDDLEWSGPIFEVYKKMIAPLIFDNRDFERENPFRVRTRALFEGPITQLTIFPLNTLSPEVGPMLPNYRFLEHFALLLNLVENVDPQLISSVIEHLSSCESLESVTLFSVNLDDDDLAKLSNLPRLKSLHMDRCQINGDPVESLSRFSNLEVLTFSGDLGLEEEMFVIKRHLGDCKFTVNGVEIPNLTEFLNLNPSPETEAPF